MDTTVHGAVRRNVLYALACGGHIAHRLMADEALLDILPDRDISVKQVSALGGALSEDFDDALGIDGRITGQPLPQVWSVTGDRRLTFSNHVTRQFATRTGRLSNRLLGDGDVFNAGVLDDPDRALVTSVSRSGVGSEIGLYVEFPDGWPRALRMIFDLEMWGADDRIREPGTAAFDVEVGALLGGESLGMIATDRVPVDVNPSSSVNGNEPAFRTKFDSGVIDLRGQNLDGLDIAGTPSPISEPRGGHMVSITSSSPPPVKETQTLTASWTSPTF